MTNPIQKARSVLLALAVFLLADAALVIDGTLPLLPQTDQLAAQTDHDEEQMFLEARRALNRDEFEQAAELFQALRDRYHAGRFVADSYYWEAFARYRLEDLPEAVALLETLEGGYAEAREDVFGNKGRLRDEVVQLRLRIRRQQAEQGDPRAAEEVLRQSEMLLGRELHQAGVQAAQRQLEAAVAAQQAGVQAAQRQLEAAGVTQQARVQAAQRQQEEAVAAQQAYVRAALARQLQPALAELDYATTGLSMPLWRYAFSQVPEGCEDAAVQQAALSALLELETERMTSVRSVLDRRDACSVNLQRTAVFWLTRQGTEEAENALVSVAQDHPNVEIRQAAVSGLSTFGTPRAAQALSNILAQSEDPGVATAAIWSLWRRADVGATERIMAVALDTARPLELRRVALAAYARRNDVTPEALMQLYGTEGLRGLESDILRDVATRAQAGDAQVAEWLFERAMDTGEPVEIRMTALEAWSIAPSVDLENIARFYEQLEETELKERIFFALYRKAQSGAVDVPAIVDTMIELARGEADVETQERAVHWIGRIGSERAVEFLLELLRERPGEPPGP